MNENSLLYWYLCVDPFNTSFSVMSHFAHIDTNTNGGDRSSHKQQPVSNDLASSSYLLVAGALANFGHLKKKLYLNSTLL